MLVFSSVKTYLTPSERYKKSCSVSNNFGTHNFHQVIFRVWKSYLPLNLLMRSHLSEADKESGDYGHVFLLSLRNFLH